MGPAQHRDTATDVSLSWQGTRQGGGGFTVSPSDVPREVGYMEIEVLVEQVSEEGTTSVGIGRRLDNDERIAFHGDYRMMRRLAYEVAGATTEDDLPIAIIERWQIAGER